MCSALDDGDAVIGYDSRVVAALRALMRPGLVAAIAPDLLAEWARPVADALLRGRAGYGDTVMRTEQGFVPLLSVTDDKDARQDPLRVPWVRSGR
jgi:hypothetical protein